MGRKLFIKSVSPITYLILYTVFFSHNLKYTYCGYPQDLCCMHTVTQFLWEIFSMEGFPSGRISTLLILITLFGVGQSTYGIKFILPALFLHLKNGVTFPGLTTCEIYTISKIKIVRYT